MFYSIVVRKPHFSYTTMCGEKRTFSNPVRKAPVEAIIALRAIMASTRVFRTWLNIFFPVGFCKIWLVL